MILFLSKKSSFKSFLYKTSLQHHNAFSALLLSNGVPLRGCFERDVSTQKFQRKKIVLRIISQKQENCKTHFFLSGDLIADERRSSACFHCSLYYKTHFLLYGIFYKQFQFLTFFAFFHTFYMYFR